MIFWFAHLQLNNNTWHSFTFKSHSILWLHIQIKILATLKDCFGSDGFFFQYTNNEIIYLPPFTFLKNESRTIWTSNYWKRTFLQSILQSMIYTVLTYTNNEMIYLFRKMKVEPYEPLIVERGHVSFRQRMIHVVSICTNNEMIYLPPFTFLKNESRTTLYYGKGTCLVSAINESYDTDLLQCVNPLRTVEWFMQFANKCRAPKNPPTFLEWWQNLHFSNCFSIF